MLLGCRSGKKRVLMECKFDYMVVAACFYCVHFARMCFLTDLINTSALCYEMCIITVLP